jgi:hypothetical protein
VSLGQFKVAEDCLQSTSRAISVEAMEMEEDLKVSEKPTALQSVAILYLVTLNGIAVILRGRESSSRGQGKIPPCFPLGLVDTSVVNFVDLVRSYKSRLKTIYSDTFIQEVTDQHKLMVRAVSREAAFRSALEACSGKTFEQAWAPAGCRFNSLRIFCGGLGAVMPTTSRMEGDFSEMSYRKDAKCAALSNYSLEGVMKSKRFHALQRAVAYIE